MANSETLRSAGAVNVDFVEIVTAKGFIQNITSQVLGISVYEDIFSPFITGRLTIKDSQDLVNLFPLVGEEFMSMVIRTPSFNDKSKYIKGKYLIYKMSEREFLTDRSSVYVLHFISIEALIDINKKTSKAYEGRVSDIVNRIVKTEEGINTDKGSLVEYTPNGIKFISNYWSPVKCINYCASQALNVKNSPSYIFFENRSGFNFVSLNYLYQIEPVQEFIYDNYINGDQVKRPEEQFKRIVDISINTGFDYLEKVQTGMYGSKLISYDLVSKKYTQKNFSILDNYYSQSHLNANAPSSTSSIYRENALIFTEGRHINNFTGYGQSKNKQERLSLLGQAEFHKISITVPGRTDYTVGQTVSVKLYKTNQITESRKEDDLDKVYSGKYIMAAIHHDIDREQHLCHIELIKDSLVVDLNKGR